MLKKGDLSINLIVIAVVGLLILVILVAIFSGRMGIFSDGTQEPLERRCSDISGSQVVPFSDPCPDNTVQSFDAYRDVPAGSKCCVPPSAQN